MKFKYRDMKKKLDRDITKIYPKKQFIAKIRRLADALENDEKFTIQVANEKLNIPKDAVVNIEHERGEGSEELEFQIIWKNN